MSRAGDSMVPRFPEYWERVARALAPAEMGELESTWMSRTGHNLRTSGHLDPSLDEKPLAVGDMTFTPYKRSIAAAHRPGVRDGYYAFPCSRCDSKLLYYPEGFSDDWDSSGFSNRSMRTVEPLEPPWIDPSKVDSFWCWSEGRKVGGPGFRMRGMSREEEAECKKLEAYYEKHRRVVPVAFCTGCGNDIEGESDGRFVPLSFPDNWHEFPHVAYYQNVVLPSRERYEKKEAKRDAMDAERAERNAMFEEDPMYQGYSSSSSSSEEDQEETRRRAERHFDRAQKLAKGPRRRRRDDESDDSSDPETSDSNVDAETPEQKAARWAAAIERLRAAWNDGHPKARKMCGPGGGAPRAWRRNADAEAKRRALQKKRERRENPDVRREEQKHNTARRRAARNKPRISSLERMYMLKGIKGYYKGMTAAQAQAQRAANEQRCLQVRQQTVRAKRDAWTAGFELKYGRPPDEDNNCDWIGYKGYMKRALGTDVASYLDTAFIKKRKLEYHRPFDGQRHPEFPEYIYDESWGNAYVHRNDPWKFLSRKSAIDYWRKHA